MQNLGIKMAMASDIALQRLALLIIYASFRFSKLFMAPMNTGFEINKYSGSVYTDFIDRLKRFYVAMDQAYNRAAGHYGFACAGCRDNCCRTRFYHHTVIEYTYIIEGLATLTLKKKIEVKSRAMAVVEETAKADSAGETVRQMCPLNFDELCILYPYRPMICRLHGIPHEFKKPGQKTIYGSGCETFDHRCGRIGYFEFDRTPFYLELAKLEKAVRQALGIAVKFKMTVAEIIVTNA
jgi:Fe-S-cluster containining protein